MKVLFLICAFFFTILGILSLYGGIQDLINPPEEIPLIIYASSLKHHTEGFNNRILIGAEIEYTGIYMRNNTARARTWHLYIIHFEDSLVTLRANRRNVHLQERVYGLVREHTAMSIRLSEYLPYALGYFPYTVVLADAPHTPTASSDTNLEINRIKAI